ncbi:MAG: glycoside hydrolase family 3 C-terminal domain-containing protein [Alistipes sp.]|nr:glycoside hydrolase family 3 C-terminal domain-containing protein [Alistipes sp.]
MRKFSLFLLAIIVAMPLSAQYKVTQERKDRAAAIVKQMTLEEKIDYIGGHDSWYVRAIDRLGLPAVRMADGPQGVRNNTRSTLYPSGVAAAATWDTELIQQMGVSLGKDARARGVHILLGPGANIYRSPLCGRNFEYFGEDPFLAGEIATAYIKGVQSMGVMACIKHFAGNNQEWARHSVSSDIDERTLNEIYFPAFEKAVKEGNVATIMTSYNLLNGVHASESKYLNQDVLRGQWGFDGFVMSDWTSCYSPVNVARWGVDLEMPYAQCVKPELIKKLVEQGVIDERALDKKCQNIIQTIFAFEFDKREQLDKSLPENNPECDAVAHKLSQSAIVMLKNEENFLPIKKGKVVVCGPNADKIVTGGGSGFVTPLHACSVAEGMATMGKNIKSTFVSMGDVLKPVPGVVYADKEMTKKGIAAEYYTNAELEGKPFQSFITDKVGIDDNKFGAHNDMVKVSTRHTFYYKPEKDESYHFSVCTNDGYRCYLNDKLVMRDRWHKSSSQEGYMLLEMKAGQVYKFELQHQNLAGSIYADMTFESTLATDIPNAEAIKAADCVVVCLGHSNRTEKENYDRTFELPRGQVEYLHKILQHNKNVVVVLNGGGAIEMASWMNDVKAVLMAWYPGQQGGLAISEIITGKISPSGKLPISIEAKLEDNPSAANYHENVDRIRSKDINPHSRVEYREGIFMGYRGYEKSGVKPLFPFGFGLSYTSFDYSNLEIKAEGKEFIVSFDIKNSGKMAASEVAQVYVGDDECSLVRPAKELKGFTKVYLKAGESKRVSVRLDEEAFRFFDPIERKFKVEAGSFTVKVGTSSADIRLTGKLEVK